MSVWSSDVFSSALFLATSITNLRIPASPSVAADAIQVPSPPEHGNQLQVAGPGELVDGRRLCESIAAVDQGAGVACEGGRVAGNGDDGRHVGGSDLRRLLARAVARRIEQIGRAHV